MRSLKLLFVCMTVITLSLTSCSNENELDEDIYAKYEVLDLTVDPMVDAIDKVDMLKNKRTGEYTIEILETAGVYKVQFKNDKGQIYWKVGILERGTEIMVWDDGVKTAYVCINEIFPWEL